MNQFLNLNDPNAQGRKMTENRVLMLSQKINSLKFGHKAQSQKKLDQIQKTCQQIETEIQNIKNIFDNNCFDLKHIMTRLQKELNYDYHGTDRMVKQEIRKTQERFVEMTQAHMYERKRSDARLAKFMEEKCALLRDLIQRQMKQRNRVGQEIEQSLTQDIIQIKAKLQEQKTLGSENLQSVHTQFLTEYEQMHKQFQQLCEKSSQNQGQFYKMLRDILKKVKEQLAQDKIKREDMEETILALIEKICDKAIQEVNL